MLTNVSWGQIELPSEVTPISSIDRWCSNPKAFSTVGLTERYTAPCWKEPAGTRGKMFSFVAAGPDVEVILKRGDSWGSLTEPRLLLLDANLKIVACENYPLYTDYLTLTFDDLRSGQTYYILAGHPAHSQYEGSFSLCVSSSVGYDFMQGAHILHSTTKYCSGTEEFTTANATPDPPHSSCNGDNGNFNRWFKFKANTTKIEITTKVSDQESKFDFPIITLFDASGKELTCEKYIDTKYKANSRELTLAYNQLSKGQWYYFSVDHPRNSKYLGKFGLCVDNGAQHSAFTELGFKGENGHTVTGRIQSKDRSPIAGKIIQIKSTDGKLLGEVQTDANGRFKFGALDPEQEVEIELPSDFPDALIEMYRLENDEKIIGRSAQMNNGPKVTFKALPAEMNNISLLDAEMGKSLLTDGQGGIIGKVVDRFDPIDGIEGIQVWLYKHPTSQPVVAKTDASGMFKFDRLDEHAPYMIKLDTDVNKVQAEMIRLNESHEPIQTASTGEVDLNGFFHFDYLPKIEAEKLGLMEIEDVSIDFSALPPNASIPLPKIRFNYGSAELMQSSMAQIEKLTDDLKSQTDVSICIHGHTDNLGSSKANQQLSQLRAASVKQFLIDHGINAERLTIQGHGGSKPVADNSTAEGRSKNRRVEIQLIQ